MPGFPCCCERLVKSAQPKTFCEDNWVGETFQKGNWRVIYTSTNGGGGVGDWDATLTISEGNLGQGFEIRASRLNVASSLADEVIVFSGAAGEISIINDGVIPAPVCDFSNAFVTLTPVLNNWSTLPGAVGSQGPDWGAQQDTSGAQPTANYEVTVSGVVLATTNEIQVVEAGGAPTAGTFLLTFEGQQTAAIPFDVSAAGLKAALELLPNITSVIATGGPLPGTVINIEFVDPNGNRAQMVEDDTLLVGGTIIVFTDQQGITPSSAEDCAEFNAMRFLLLPNRIPKSALLPIGQFDNMRLDNFCDPSGQCDQSGGPSTLPQTLTATITGVVADVTGGARATEQNATLTVNRMAETPFAGKFEFAYQGEKRLLPDVAELFGGDTFGPYQIFLYVFTGFLDFEPAGNFFSYIGVVYVETRGSGFKNRRLTNFGEWQTAEPTAPFDCTDMGSVLNLVPGNHNADATPQTPFIDFESNYSSASVTYAT